MRINQIYECGHEDCVKVRNYLYVCKKCNYKINLDIDSICNKCENTCKKNKKECNKFVG